jgi:hypothetical protein
MSLSGPIRGNQTLRIVSSQCGPAGLISGSSHFDLRPLRLPLSGHSPATVHRPPHSRRDYSRQLEANTAMIKGVDVHIGGQRTIPCSVCDENAGLAT